MVMYWRFPMIHGHQSSRAVGTITMAAIVLMSTSCATPAQRFDRTAVSLGLQRDVVQGTVFEHVLFWRNGNRHKALHVYLGGDGTPVMLGRATDDPTPRNPLMLRLLSRDSGPAVYVGRPCYHGRSTSAVCTSEIWTSARYSEPVVESLTVATRRTMKAHEYQDLVLIGYSGGGTLAMLLAGKLAQTREVITVAANLDIDAWTDLHGYSRLTTSINPMTRGPLQPSIAQRHYAGERDQVVPISLSRDAASRLGATLSVVRIFNHECCWEAEWPAIINRVAAWE